MLNLTRQDIQSTGGFLSALTKHSENYLRSVIQSQGHTKFPHTKELNYLERIIVHTAPHIDEYVAELLFRACLPPTIDTARLQFHELSIYSKNNDLSCKNLFPSAAVFGIGRAASGGSNALFLFDEHLEDKGTGKARAAESCSQIVANSYISNIPHPIHIMLREVNAIDTFGGAHPQHLGNLIKKIHEIRFSFNNQMKGFLDANWKRALVDTSIAAIVYCLANNIDIFSNLEEKIKALKSSLDSYNQRCIHRSHQHFEKVRQRIFSIYLNKAILNEPNAHLKNRSGAIKENGKPIPQLFMLARCCFACYQCWGPLVTDIVFTHFWEAIFQQHLDFIVVQSEAETYFSKPGERFDTAIGDLRRKILSNGLWVVGVSPNSLDFRDAIKESLINYIHNIKTKGAILLIEDPFRNTKAVFKVQGDVADSLWPKIVKQLLAEGCWHHTSPTAQFVINGNAAHLYVPRSSVDFDLLVKMASG